jgi:hypothetical protein
MTTQDYENDLARITKNALNNNVPVEDVILTMESTVFELRFTLLQMRKAEAMRRAQSGIIKSSIMPPTPKAN